MDDDDGNDADTTLLKAPLLVVLPSVELKTDFKLMNLKEMDIFTQNSKFCPQSDLGPPFDMGPPFWGYGGRGPLVQLWLYHTVVYISYFYFYTHYMKFKCF